MRRLPSFRRDESGATLVEATLVVPLMLLLTFGLVEFGYVMWQFHATEKATAIGVRWLASRHGVKGEAAVTNELYTATVPDCFASTSNPPGTLCSQVAGATSWSQTCSGTGGGNCSSTTMSGLLTEMQKYAPFIKATNVSVQLQGTKIGFVGRGRAVPLITVRTTGLTYNYIALGALVPGLGSITMPSFASSAVGEDQKEGPGI